VLGGNVLEWHTQNNVAISIARRGPNRTPYREVPIARPEEHAFSEASQEVRHIPPIPELDSSLGQQRLVA
jgi:hypothetical protein